MFNRKKTERANLDKVIKEGIEESVKQKEDSQKELDTARDTVSILKRIRMENHIVHDLREVLGGH